MSWQDYITSYLTNTFNANNEKWTFNVCNDAWLCSNENGDVWAFTEGFNITDYPLEIENEDGSMSTINYSEFQSVKDVFENKGIVRLPGGIRLNNEKYFIVTFDEDRDVMYLKKNQGGAVVARTNIAFVIATWNQNSKYTDVDGNVLGSQTGPLANAAAENLQKFLLENDL